MSYIQTPEVSIEVVNQAFMDKIEHQTKEAMEIGSDYIRQKLRETGVLRRLFEPVTIGADELDPDIDSDIPRILCELEPNAQKATFVPFKGTGDSRYFEGKRFPIPFGKIESPTQHKSKFELMSIKMDIMKWLQDDQIKAVQEEEDMLFIETLAAIITANSAQAFTATSGTFKDNFVEGLKYLTAQKLPVGKALMSKNTYLDSQKLKSEDIGYAPQEKRYAEGLDGEESFMGVPVVTTLNTDICPDGKIRFFAPQEYFCKFYLLQDATLFIKNEKDMVSFSTYEAPGVGIGNTIAFCDVTLNLA